MTGQPCPYGFGPGSIVPYGFNGGNAAAFGGSFNQATGSYQTGVFHPAHDWQNKTYAPPQAAPAQDVYTVCPKHIEFLDHQQQCRENKALKAIVGAGAGATGSWHASQGPCSVFPEPGASFCKGIATGIGGAIGARLGYNEARLHPSCIVVDGAGRCVDASHNH